MRQSNLGVADLGPLGLAAIFVAYGAYLLVIGPAQTIVTPGAGSTTEHTPNAVGLLVVVAGGLVTYGIWAGRDRMAWAGGFLSLFFTIAGVFSYGGLLIPVSLLLLVSLAIRWKLARPRATRG